MEFRLVTLLNGKKEIQISPIKSEEHFEPWVVVRDPKVTEKDEIILVIRGGYLETYEALALIKAITAARELAINLTCSSIDKVFRDHKTKNVYSEASYGN